MLRTRGDGGAESAARNDAFDAGVEFGFRAFVASGCLPGRLTRMESRVLSCVREGLQDKEIACRLNFSTRTAKFHVGSLLRKFGVHGRKELA